MKYIFQRMWLRAVELYIGAVVFTLFFTYVAIKLGHTDIKLGLWYPVSSWRTVIVHSLDLTYTFGWTDFLGRFALMMLAAPIAFYLLVKKLWWLLALISIVLWAGPGNNNPGDTLNWQLLFMGGMISGYYWNELKDFWGRVAAKRRCLLRSLVAWSAALTFTLSYASVYVLSELNAHLGALPKFWQSFTLHWNTINADLWVYAQKWTLGPLRIVLFIVWFAAIFMLVQKFYPTIKHASHGVVEMLGQNSLFVYVDHAFIIFAAKLLIPRHTSFWQNFLITGSALALLIATTKLYVHHGPKLSARKANLISQLPWLPANIEN
jgi:hypothetical protein